MSLQNAPESASQRSDATVTVNSQATYRRGEYFHKEISVSNGSGPVWQSLSIQAVDSASSNSDTGNQFVPKTPELYDHDADGNLLYDGRWDCTWDYSLFCRKNHSNNFGSL